MNVLSIKNKCFTIVYIILYDNLVSFNIHLKIINIYKIYSILIF